MRPNKGIFQRGKIWWVAYYLRGKEYRESTKETDEVKAGKFLQRRLKEVHADEIGARTFTTPKASRLTMHELLEALKADFELRGKGSAQNLSVLKRADTDFGAYRAVDLTAEKIDAYIEQRLGDGDAKATINRTTQLLGQAYALAIRRGHLSRAPYIRHLSETGNARQGFFSEPELAAVISHLPEDLRDFVRFAAATGMRKGECCSLTWSDLEGDVLTLQGEHAKNGEARSVPLVGELAEIIERRKAARQVKENGTARMIEHIFHRRGQPVAEFRKSWVTACLAAGVGRMVCPNCKSEGTAKSARNAKAAPSTAARSFMTCDARPSGT
jgi:integrase